MSFVGPDDFKKYKEYFIKLFRDLDRREPETECSRNILISRALMTFGDYGRSIGNKLQYAASEKEINAAWRDMFRMRSDDTGFNNMGRILRGLLDRNSFEDEGLEMIISDYIGQCKDKGKYPWNYYYVRYWDCFRSPYGKYTDPDNSQPYMRAAISTKTYVSANTYMPFLWAAEKQIEKEFPNKADEIDLSEYKNGSQTLTVGDMEIRCKNEGYIINGKDLDIPQEKGVDTVDRVERLCKKIRDYINTGGSDISVTE